MKLKFLPIDQKSKDVLVYALIQATFTTLALGNLLIGGVFVIAAAIFTVFMHENCSNTLERLAKSCTNVLLLVVVSPLLGLKATGCVIAAGLAITLLISLTLYQDWRIVMGQAGVTTNSGIYSVIVVATAKAYGNTNPQTILLAVACAVMVGAGFYCLAKKNGFTNLLRAYVVAPVCHTPFKIFATGNYFGIDERVTALVSTALICSFFILYWFDRKHIKLAGELMPGSGFIFYLGYSLNAPSAFNEIMLLLFAIGYAKINFKISII